MPEKYFTEAQVCRMIRDEVFLHTKRLMTHVTRKLQGAPTLTTQQYRPEDDFPSNEPEWSPTPTRQRSQANGYGQHGDEGYGPSNHPDER